MAWFDIGLTLNHALTSLVCTMRVYARIALVLPSFFYRHVSKSCPPRRQGGIQFSTVAADFAIKTAKKSRQKMAV